jgi:hypothetical protein
MLQLPNFERSPGSPDQSSNSQYEGAVVEESYVEARILAQVE